MSKMDSRNTDSLKENVMSSDPRFRELSREERRYEARLIELSRLAYPSDEEQLEEVALKKKRLAIKDQMYSLLVETEKDAEGMQPRGLTKKSSSTRAVGASRNTTEKTPNELFPPPRTRLIEAAFAAHAECLKHGDGPLSIEQINAEVAERRGGAQGDASH